ncbi:TPA: RHS repeat protein, partial [Enterobacter cloacae]|nr:RHS repeat protein [Enterobacter cloacae]
SDANRAWLAQCGLTPEQIQNQMEPEYTPLRKIHLYHCDHRGLPLALVSHEGATEWEAEYDAWGNMLRETNPHNLAQLIRLPGQQYDEETGLYYNRHRYYDPKQGRYITQDPIGLRGGWNFYTYTSNPISEIDPLGLAGWDSLGDGGLREVCLQAGSAVNYLPANEAEGVIHNIETMHNVYNPLSEYTLGITIGSTVVGLGGMSFAAASVAEKGSACIKDVAESMIKEGERDPKNLALSCSKSFINEGSSNFQNKVSDYLIDVLSSYKQKQ